MNTSKRPDARTRGGQATAEDRARRMLRELQSGESTAQEIAARHGIKVETLKWWRYEIARRDRKRAHGAEVQQFLPVRLIAPPAAPDPATRFSPPSGPYEVVLRCGRVVRVRADFDPARLAVLVAAVEGSPC